LEFMKG